MTIKELFDYADENKPNAFSDATKCAWLNEVEGKVQTDIFLWPLTACIEHKLAYSGNASVFFPDEHTLAFSDPTQKKNFRPGGKIKNFSPGSPYANNAFTARVIQGVTEAGLVFSGSFTDTGDTPVITQITYDGTDAELLAPFPFDKLYREYLCARIDYANGEYDKYQNTMAMFNEFWGEYSRWYARTVCPAGLRK